MHGINESLRACSFYTVQRTSRRCTIKTVTLFTRVKSQQMTKAWCEHVHVVTVFEKQWSDKLDRKTGKSVSWEKFLGYHLSAEFQKSHLNSCFALSTYGVIKKVCHQIKWMLITCWGWSLLPRRFASERGACFLVNFKNNGSSHLFAVGVICCYKLLSDAWLFLLFFHLMFCLHCGYSLAHVLPTLPWLYVAALWCPSTIRTKSIPCISLLCFALSLFFFRWSSRVTGSLRNSSYRYPWLHCGTIRP